MSHRHYFTQASAPLALPACLLFSHVSALREGRAIDVSFRAEHSGSCSLRADQFQTSVIDHHLLLKQASLSSMLIYGYKDKIQLGAVLLCPLAK